MKDLEKHLFAFCEAHGLSIDKPPSRKIKVNYIISSGNGKAVGVILLDWKRAIGVDIVIRAEKIEKSTRKFNKIIILTNSYSDPASSLGERIAVGVYAPHDLHYIHVEKELGL